MIILTFLTLGLKYIYDSFVMNFITEDDKFLESFVDMTDFYVYYETISILDSLIVFMMAISVTKYTFFWIPALTTISKSLEVYLNSTIKKIFLFVLGVSFIFSAYSHFFFANVTYGFFDFSYSLIRTSLLFVQGNLFNKNTAYIVDETAEYIYTRENWVIAILSMGMMHLFGRYVVLNIIVSMMKKDLSDTRKKVEE